MATVVYICQACFLVSTFIIAKNLCHTTPAWRRGIITWQVQFSSFSGKTDQSNKLYSFQYLKCRKMNLSLIVTSHFVFGTGRLKKLYNVWFWWSYYKISNDGKEELLKDESNQLIRLKCTTHTLFQTKLAKIYALQRPEQLQKQYPLVLHIPKSILEPWQINKHLPGLPSPDVNSFSKTSCWW